ncbi:tetratricopeptide repeat (TPR)-like superfamily protein [Tasmannia lanceolata]|uniref:tetratricopeptide repeat (TPR)-like superfamily protein n=1 Tax=Tasmannia lanceolata TaxID=3420 RepID=UPI0040645C66
MKIAWKKSSTNKRTRPTISSYPNLPFDPTDDKEEEKLDNDKNSKTQLADSFQSQGNRLAEDGRYREALVKWEGALTLMPERAVLHEQKAQVLLEIGDVWNALRAATRATELEPSWAEAWITLARTQLNYGEPDASVESFDRALAIKPDSEEARDDRDIALHLVKRRKQLHSSGLTSVTEIRYKVGDKGEIS